MYTNLASYAEELSFARTTSFTAVNMLSGEHYIKGYSAFLKVTDITPAAGAFTAANATEIFTKAAHGMLLGLKVQVSNAGGALPAGLVAVTDYFVIPIDTNTFYLATTLNNAVAGTHLSITTDGTGTQTITPTALAGLTQKHSVSLTGEADEYVDLAAAAALATGNTLIQKIDPEYKYVVLTVAITAGQVTIEQNLMTTGE